MDTKALRQKILDLAIRGKLVPQDPNDEPASVLLERIREQKKQMVKEGILKAKDIKNDSVIFVGEDNLHYEKFADGSVKCIEDEIPFELPEGWSWSRLGSVFSTVTGSTPSTKDSSFYGDEYPFYKPTDLDAGFDVYHAEDSVSEKGYLSGRILPYKSVLVTCIGATIGKTGYIRNTGICNQQINAILPNDEVSSEYTYFCMCSEFEQQQIWTNSSATTLPILNKSKFDTLLFPVPPKEQQMLIVGRIKELLCFVEIIQAENTTLQETIKKTKSKILDLAIRGQLVPQNPDDEPASVLLERIRAEKEELIKQGKIKRDKKESIILKGEDNSYYDDIPDGWTVCYLRELFNVCSAKRVKQSDWCTEGVPFYRAREIVKLSDNDFVDNELYISEDHYQQVKKEYGIPQPGDLMVSGVGTIGKVYVVKDTDRFYYKDASVLCFENRNRIIDSQYARYMLMSEFIQNQMKENSKGTTVDTITISAAMNYICLVPPINEQKRIVSAIEQILNYLKIIESALL